MVGHPNAWRDAYVDEYSAYHRVLRCSGGGAAAAGKTADRPDGAVGICGDHAAGQSGGHPHAGRGHSPVLRSGAHSHGTGVGAGVVLGDYEKCADAQIPLRQAGDSH